MGRLTIPLVLVLLTAGLAGCIGGEEGLDEASTDDQAPGAGSYELPERDPSTEILEHAELIEIPDHDIEIHVRIARPATEDPVPVIAEFTPYNAPGRAMAIEPMVAEPSGTFVEQFVQRGFAFAYADVRGTADSGGCLDLRGSMDILDAWHLTEFLGTQAWSNGKVGFIGASYPGSEAHIAAIANNEHLGGVVPVVASTSFYHYHHKGGVPYDNHLTTNAGYTGFATAPTANPQHGNWLTRQTYEATDCDQPTQLGKAADQSGTYDAWWQDRDLAWRTDQIEVPVLMAQGLADWNVKPDHIATWYNDLATDKTLIAGQWGHAWPEDTDEDVYGDWWALATAFFDQTLDGAETGLFDQDRAYVQANDGTWLTYQGTWPPANATWTSLNLTDDGLTWDQAPDGEVSWQASPQDTATPAGGQVILESQALEADLHTSGTPHLNLTIVPEAEDVHLVAVLEVLRDGTWVRENHGYLNPIYREGLDRPQRVIPGQATPVTIEMYPQEDVFEEGETLRLVLRSHDDGRTVPAYDDGGITVQLDGQRPGQLWLPVSPMTR